MNLLIYGALFIPILTAIILYWQFRHKTVWWEFFIPLAASIVFIVSAKALIEYVQVSSVEYWGSFIKQIEYYEDWNEYISRTCTQTCCCDSKGGNCSTTTYDCYYVQYHPPYWQIRTTTEETVEITRAEYSRLKTFLGGENFQELNRNYYTDDGDEYYCSWLGDSIKAIPVTTIHTYENRIKAADQSVFHFEQVDTSAIRRFALKDYPDIADCYKMDALIGDTSQDADTANKKLQYINGLLGHKKQVRVFMCVFQNQPIQAALYQKSYWSGGNMNEFVICIGTDKERNVKWCYPVSWTPNETLKAEVRQFVMSQNKLNLSAIADYLHPTLNKFQRRDFKEFDYLTVDPPLWSVLLTYFLTIALNVGLSWWIIKNEYEE